MKKLMALVIALIYIISLSSCSLNLTEKSDIISLYQNNEEVFLQAGESGNFSALEDIKGVQSVYISEEYVDISCGAEGFGANTHYYGIFYSADDNMCAIDVAAPKDKLVEHGQGFLYQENGGDNRYYVEPLGNFFYYYEAHF